MTEPNRRGLARASAGDGRMEAKPEAGAEAMEGERMWIGRWDFRGEWWKLKSAKMV